MTPTQFTATTSQVCAALAIDRRTLKRIIAEGFLQPGEHYRQHGVGRVRPRLRWNLEAVDEAISQRTRRLKVGQS